MMSVNVATLNTHMRVTKNIIFQYVHTILIYSFLEILFCISLSEELLRKVSAVNTPWDSGQSINTSHFLYVYYVLFL